MMTLLIIIVLIMLLGGGWGYRNEAGYGAPVMGLGGILLIILIILLLNGRI